MINGKLSNTSTGSKPPGPNLSSFGTSCKSAPPSTLSCSFSSSISFLFTTALLIKFCTNLSHPSTHRHDSNYNRATHTLHIHIETNTHRHKKKNTPSKRTSLSNALKTGTSVSHASAESVHFVKEFIKGNIDRDLYSQLILNLYFVYDVLERELDTHGPIHFPTVHFPEQLGRRETLC